MAVTPRARKAPQCARWQEQQDKDEHALRRGADRQQDFRRRRVLAHEERAQRVCSGEREGGAEKGGEEGHRRIGAPAYSSTVSICRSSCAGGTIGARHRRGAQELQQRCFGAIEIAVHQLAQGGAAHRIARGLRGVDEGAAHFAARQLALAHQAVQHRHDRGVGQRAGKRDDLLHGPDIAFLSDQSALRHASSSGGGTSRAVFGIRFAFGRTSPACNSFSAIRRFAGHRGRRGAERGGGAGGAEGFAAAGVGRGRGRGGRRIQVAILLQRRRAPAPRCSR